MIALSKSTSVSTSKVHKELRYLTFSLGGYLFALPSQDVLKIVVTPPPERGGMVDRGLVQLSQYSIQVLDLSALLKLERSAIEAESRLANTPTLLIILQIKQTLWGIEIEQPPDILSIKSSELKQVPDSKRISDALQGISQIVSRTHLSTETTSSDELKSKEKPQIWLVLDVEKLAELS